MKGTPKYCTDLASRTMQARNTRKAYKYSKQLLKTNHSSLLSLTFTILLDWRIVDNKNLRRRFSH